MDVSATHNNSNEAQNNSKLSVEVGQRVAKFRNSLGLSQDEMAARAGGTKRGLQQNEQGIALPNSKLLLSFYELGANINWILTGDGDMRWDQTTKPSVPPKKNLHTNEDKLEAAIQISDAFIAEHGAFFDATRRSALTMLVYDAINDGKGDNELSRYLTKLKTLIFTENTPDPSGKQLPRDEQALLRAYREGSKTKKELMLGHVPTNSGISKAA